MLNQPKYVVKANMIEYELFHKAKTTLNTPTNTPPLPMNLLMAKAAGRLFSSQPQQYCKKGLCSIGCRLGTPPITTTQGTRIANFDSQYVTFEFRLWSSAPPKK